MELILSLDKAKRHRGSIRDALYRRRVPPGLRIKITLNVMNKEDPEFTNQWNKKLQAAETALACSILRHLNNIILNLDQKIRTTTKNFLKNL